MKKKFENRFIAIFLSIAVVVYLGSASTNYSLEYKNKELEEKINDEKKQTQNIEIKKNTTFSKEEAESSGKLKFNDNIYYLKDKDE